MPVVSIVGQAALALLVLAGVLAMIGLAGDAIFQKWGRTLLVASVMSMLLSAVFASTALVWFVIFWALGF